MKLWNTTGTAQLPLKGDNNLVLLQGKIKSNGIV